MNKSLVLLVLLGFLNVVRATTVPANNDTVSATTAEEKTSEEGSSEAASEPEAADEDVVAPTKAVPTTSTPPSVAAKTAAKVTTTKSVLSKTSLPTTSSATVDTKQNVTGDTNSAALKSPEQNVNASDKRSIKQERPVKQNDTKDSTPTTPKTTKTKHTEFKKRTSKTTEPTVTTKTTTTKASKYQKQSDKKVSTEASTSTTTTTTTTTSPPTTTTTTTSTAKPTTTSTSTPKASETRAKATAKASTEATKSSILSTLVRDIHVEETPITRAPVVEEPSEIISSLDKDGVLSDIHAKKQIPPLEEPSSNFPVLFMVSILAIVGGYFLYHNKSKILGLIVEGRGGASSRLRPRYNRLRNVEEAMPGMRSKISA